MKIAPNKCFLFVKVDIDLYFFFYRGIKIVYLVLERFEAGLVCCHITIHKQYIDGYLRHLIECRAWFQRLLEK